jgi:polyisoprenoid-binding protein YceI
MHTNNKKWIAAVLGVVVVAVAAFGIWYFVFRDDSPPAVSLDRATGRLEETTKPTGGSSSTLDGRWTVDTSIGSFSDFSSSFAGFRVQEELVGVGAKTAVGRTPNVSGSMEIDGATIPEASFEVDMTTLTTDDARRDNAIRMQAIETSRFPKATFTLTTPIALGSVPAEGQTIRVDATCDLTLHGVTKRVTIPLEAKRTGDVITVVGSLEIPFADYSINKPSAAAVLSVEDKGVMEVQLFFTRAT